MSFNGNEGEFITLEEGAAMTARFRNSVQAGKTIGQFVGREKLMDVIGQENCVGIRFFVAHESLQSSIVFVNALRHLQVFFLV